MAYVIVAILSAATGAFVSYLYHSKEAAKVAAVQAEIKQLEAEGVAAEQRVVSRIKSLL